MYPPQQSGGIFLQRNDKINEAMMFGLYTLKNHLLLMVNLYICNLQQIDESI